MFYANFLDLIACSALKKRALTLTGEVETYFWKGMPWDRYKVAYNRFLDFKDRDKKEFPRYE